MQKKIDFQKIVGYVLLSENGRFIIASFVCINKQVPSPSLLRSEASPTSFSELCGTERSSWLKRVTFHGTEKEKEQPDWRKYR